MNMQPRRGSFESPMAIVGAGILIAILAFVTIGEASAQKGRRKIGELSKPAEIIPRTGGWFGRPVRIPINLRRTALENLVLRKFSIKLPHSARLRPVASFRTARVIKPKAPLSLEIKIVTIIPKTDLAHVNIFGRDRTTQEKQSTDAALKQAEFEKAHNLGEPIEGATRLNEVFIASAREGKNTVVIVGHSKQEFGGREIVLPDGDQVSIKEIHQMANEVGLTATVITCYGKAFGIDGQITLGEALDLLKSARDVVVEPEGGLGDLVSIDGRHHPVAALQIALDQERDQRNANYVVFFGGSEDETGQALRFPCDAATSGRRTWSLASVSTAKYPILHLECLLFPGNQLPLWDRLLLHSHRVLRQLHGGFSDSGG